jgi:hypothetical protein
MIGLGDDLPTTCGIGSILHHHKVIREVRVEAAIFSLRDCYRPRDLDGDELRNIG